MHYIIYYMMHAHSGTRSICLLQFRSAFFFRIRKHNIQHFFDRANVTVTDLPEFVPLMEYNIRDNTASVMGTIRAASLTWGSAAGREVPATPDMILLADCIYYEEVGCSDIISEKYYYNCTTVYYFCFQFVS